MFHIISASFLRCRYKKCFFEYSIRMRALKKVYCARIFVLGRGKKVSDLKRIMISLPDYLLDEVDGIVALEKKNRSEFIREAMKLYIEERKKRYLREQMRIGYQEMASINLALAQESIKSEDEAQVLFEKALGV